MAHGILPQRLNSRLFRLVLVLLAALFVFGCFRPVMDNVDLGWHVAQGRWMVEHGSLYRHDVLNYPTYGQPVINEYPLFQIVLFIFWKLGWWGPCLLAAMGYLALMALLGRAAFRFGLEGSASFLATAGALLFYLQQVNPLRPHLATYLGVITLGIFLLRHRETRNWTAFWPMALLQIAWANSHGGFVLGPIMTGCFGLEMILRQAVRQRAVPWMTVRTWAAVTLLMLLASCLNAAGPVIFYPPFYQDRLESIRAYVDEMEPVAGGLASIYAAMTAMAGLAVMAAALRRRDLSWSFLFLALLLLSQSLEVRKTWPVFGLFLPLLVFSSSALGRVPAENRVLSWARLMAGFLFATVAAMALKERLDPSSPWSLAAGWRQLAAGRSEMPVRAVAWMRANGLEGRLLHRCEDGGKLQEVGYDQGETFGDTGFGKYDEPTIRLIVMVGERPELLPRYLAAYRPAYVLEDNLAYPWPWYLRQAGWRVIHYSPGAVVWTQSGTRPDLPTVSPGEIETAFDGDIAAHGLPADMTLYGRNILALNSLGREDFAFAKLTGLPHDFHHAPWYWEAARILCFQTPSFSADHRGKLFAEAQTLHDDNLTADFRAHVLAATSDEEGARQILAPLSHGPMSGPASDLLLRIELKQNRPEARALAERPDNFDLRDGWHWALRAQAEEQAGRVPAALAAWKRAVFYYPDESALIKLAASFAARHQAAGLQREIDAGVAMPLPAAAPDLPVH